MWHAWVTAGCMMAILSVQILYAKQGLRVRRRLTRANIKEKVKETRRILAKLRFMAKEVQLLPGHPVSEQERVQARRLPARALASLSWGFSSAVFPCYVKSQVPASGSYHISCNCS